MNLTDAIEPIVEVTADGSSTLYLPDMDEHYHSMYGARTESEHVYIKHGLLKYLEEERKSELSVLEVGFGTGLNALLTLLVKPEKATITYHSYEIHPLSEEIIQDLFREKLSSEEWSLVKQLHQAGWDTPTQIIEGFILHKHLEDIRTATLPEVEVVYLDAFAPDKDPGLWTEEVIRQLAHATTKGGRLSTYCAKGVIRRRLEGEGFRVERTQGPPGGKREILTCKKTEQSWQRKE